MTVQKVLRAFILASALFTFLIRGMDWQ